MLCCDAGGLDGNWVIDLVKDGVVCCWGGCVRNFLCFRQV